MCDSLVIVIPAFNEDQNIADTIREWYPVVAAHDGDGRSRLLVVDDGSTDNTGCILREMSRSMPLLMVLRKPNGGHGSAVYAGYRRAIRLGADYIFQTDADGQTDAGDFEAFWNLRSGYDAVIGMRPVRGDGRWRAFIEKVLCLLLWIVFGVRVPDANAPFRLMKRELLERYIRHIPKSYPIPNVMLTTFFAYYGEHIAFRPVTFQNRKKGKGSLRHLKIARIGLRSLQSFLAFRKRM